MGHKGVSKRKPKKTEAITNSNVSNYVNTPSKENSSVQSLVKNSDTATNKGGSNSIKPGKKNKKGR